MFTETFSVQAQFRPSEVRTVYSREESPVRWACRSVGGGGASSRPPIGARRRSVARAGRSLSRLADATSAAHFNANQTVLGVCAVLGERVTELPSGHTHAQRNRTIQSSSYLRLAKTKPPPAQTVSPPPARHRAT
ncbi:hypothetical protein ACJJTC_012167 [Scirpophaga incertulas]